MPCVKLNAMSQAKAIAALLSGPHSAHELAELTGLHVLTCSEYLRALRKEHAAHISGWEPDRMGRDATPVFALGRGRDVKRRKLTQVERQARSRAKQRAARDLQVAAGRARWVPSANGRLRFEALP